jgi:hypothetical protein
MHDWRPANVGGHANGGVRGGSPRPRFVRIAGRGFGDGQNAYAHSMAWFDGWLYVGTTRNNLCLIKSNPKRDSLRPWPVKVPADVYDLDMRAQIWRYQPATRCWERVHVSPLVPGSKRRNVPRDIGYRGMTVFQGPSDPRPALYVSTMSWVESSGSYILRSTNGRDFVPVPRPGPEGAATSFRSLVPFNQRLYMSPAGEGTSFYAAKLPVVYESVDPARGLWRAASLPGFGDPHNTVIGEFASFNDFLYAGTVNPVEGYQVWKTRARGNPPYAWKKVMSLGAFRGNLNEGVLSFCAFRNALYVGGHISMGGFDRKHGVGPAAPELIRLHPDDTWDLIVGTPRLTPDGPKVPLSQIGPGFRNPACGYFWRMQQHAGYLYLGTFDSTVFLPYANLSGRPRSLATLLDLIGIDNIVRSRGGFDLWRTKDGVAWEPVTRNGFGNPYNYGARTIVSAQGRLFIGTANPFGPQVAVETAAGNWIYADNPRGGLEIWMAEA